MEKRIYIDQRKIKRIKRYIFEIAVLGVLVGFCAGVFTGVILHYKFGEPREVFIEIPQAVRAAETNTDKYYDCPLDYELQDYIKGLCEERGLSVPLVLAMIEVESGFKSDIISDGGDWGLMQLNSKYHRYFTEKYAITDFLDPYQNVRGGISLFGDYFSKYKNAEKALMCYNLGESGAEKYWDMDIYETNYTRKVREAMRKYE